MLHLALRTAETRSEYGNLESVHQLVGFLGVTIKFEADYSTKRGHILNGSLMIRVRLQTGVVNLGDLWEAREKFGQLERRVADTPDS